jgi:hypothetical protein
MHISSLIITVALVLFAGSGFGPAAFAAKPTATRAKPTPSGVTALTLVNATTQQPLRTLANDDIIDLSIDGSALNIRAETTGSFGSVAFTWDGVLLGTDNEAPYALVGDDAGILRSWTPVAGNHTLRAVSTARANGTGSPGTAIEITLSVVDSATPEPPPPPSSPPPAPLAITKFTLINSTTQQEIRALADGDTIDMIKDGSALNIRADGTGLVSSVSFSLDGSLFNLDNAAPFAVGGDMDGNYGSWTPSLGDHTLKAVPFPLANTEGTAGSPLEISFKVISSIPTLSNWNLGTGLALYDGNGQLNRALYDLLALSYDKSTMELRFGPSFSDLSPNASEDRPTLFRPASIPNPFSYIRVNPL